PAATRAPAPGQGPSIRAPLPHILSGCTAWLRPPGVPAGLAPAGPRTTAGRPAGGPARPITDSTGGAGRRYDFATDPVLPCPGGPIITGTRQPPRILGSTRQPARP